MKSSVTYEPKFVTATSNHVTAEHYKENGKYMIWYHIEGKYDYKHTIEIVQVRGLTKMLSKDELIVHIEKLRERELGSDH